MPAQDAVGPGCPIVTIGRVCPDSPRFSHLPKEIVMPARFALVVLLPLLAAAAPPDRTGRFDDDFTSNRLDRYRREGTVTWHKGFLVLGAKARLSRALGAGLTAEVHVRLRAPGGLRIRL